MKKKMEQRDQQRQAIDAEPEGIGRLAGGVTMAKDGVERSWLYVEDAAWFLRETLAWPARDRFDGLGTRGRIGVFGGGAVTLGAVVAAIAIGAGGGSGSGGATTEALVVRQAPAPAVSTAPAAPKKKTSPKPSSPRPRT